MPLGLSCARDEVLNIVCIARVFEVNARESVRTSSTVASLVLLGGCNGNIGVLGAQRLEASKRLNHHLLLLSALARSLEFLLPLGHIFLIKAGRHNHFIEAHFFFVVIFFVVGGVVLFVPRLLFVLRVLVVELGVKWAK